MNSLGTFFKLFRHATALRYSRIVGGTCLNFYTAEIMHGWPIVINLKVIKFTIHSISTTNNSYKLYMLQRSNKNNVQVKRHCHFLFRASLFDFIYAALCNSCLHCSIITLKMDSEVFEHFKHRCLKTS